MAYYKAFDTAKFKQSPVYVLCFRRYAPFDQFGVAFEGDHRASGSTSWKATSRTYGCLFFNRSEILYGFAGSSGSRWAGKASVVSLALRTLGFTTTDAAFADVSLDVVENVRPSVIAFSASTAGSNPLLPGAPDINTTVKMQFDFTKKGVLSINGGAFGDNFPNLEVFLVSPAGKSALLIDGRTTGGKDTGPSTRLPGSHDDHPLGQCHISLQLNDRGELISDFRTLPTTLPDYEPGSMTYGVHDLGDD
jgi:hypothetical protein